MEEKTLFESLLREKVKELGGWYNAHAHIDRSYVLDKKYFSHYDIGEWDVCHCPLPVKQNLVGIIHEGLAYTEKSLYERMETCIKNSISYGITKLDSFIDVTADIGLTALDVALELKETYKEKIKIRIGAYPIFGFKDDQPQRWDIFEQGCKFSDFIGTLPERDALSDHIGFDEHFRRIFHAFEKYGEELHVHVDQTNDPDENGTLTLIESKKWLLPERYSHSSKLPTVWAVHSLSVASYDEYKFMKVVEGLKKENIGVIVCPNAALSNKQNRKKLVPMHNSITRLLDFCSYDIPVRLGTDNISDIFIPSNSPDMFQEIVSAANALRFYNYSVWAKLGSGTKLNETDKMKIRNALAN